MTKYVDCYLWNAIDKVREGKAVYVLDKQEHTVTLVNMLSVNAFATLLQFGDSDRFMWWYEEECDGEL